MNFTELYQPYVTADAPDVEGQVKWLLKEVPQHIVDQAMLSVYTEMANGKVFSPDEKHTATWFLWTYLRETARAMHKEELTVYVKHLEGFHDKLAMTIDSEWSALSKLAKIWQVMTGKA